MGVFLQWYIGLLKSRPIATNMGSALVLMSAGDLMAQEIEIKKMKYPLETDDASTATDTSTYSLSENSKEQTQQAPQQKDQQGQQQQPRKPRFSLRRYGTKINLEKQHKQQRQHQQQVNNDNNQSATETAAVDNEGNIERKLTKRKLLANMIMTQKDNWSEALSSVTDKVRDDIVVHVTNDIDFFRTSTMIVWAVGAYTPFYIGVYRLFDRYMPKQTPLTVATRVAICFLLSVPINAAFFTYGTMVHHTSDWVAQVVDSSPQNQQKQKQRQTNISPDEEEKDSSRMGLLESTEAVIDAIRGPQEQPSISPSPPAFNAPLMWSTAQNKLKAELWTTVVTSGTVWIPINFLNFTIVPPHLRPLNLMVCSVFWNCYLSLAQHRDIAMPDHYCDTSDDIVDNDKKQR